MAKKFIKADNAKPEEQINPETGEVPKEQPAAEEDTRRQVEDARKAKIDYKSHITKVEELSRMTDTPAWKAFWQFLQQSKHVSAKQVLDAEKTRDIIRFQEGVKIVDGLMRHVAQPVEELNGFCSAMPLFASEFKDRAQWNAALGQVEWKRG